ncbi:OmpA family protein [Rhodopila sp.]|uniref:OmpA family protein n=1 Tax=Rhodopila sp. TaxID=2480087 RepID=UPI003D0C4155
MFKGLFVLTATATVFGATVTLAQTPQAQTPQAQTPTAQTPQAQAPQDVSTPASGTPAAGTPAAAKAPDSLSVYFSTGSATISPEGQAVLDKAARTYRDGKPIIMVVSGGSDATGAAAANLRLSEVRADNVLQGLVQRGIPIERFQVLAKGETEPAVPDPNGKPEARNRRVEISWR